MIIDHADHLILLTLVHNLRNDTFIYDYYKGKICIPMIP